jgi:prepilin-type N-terminal cleavage/methylation domain-containing protein
MKLLRKRRATNEHGFSLIELLIAMAITVTVMASVYLLLQKGQTSFQREPEVADMNQSARAGLQRISQDLALAGLETPPVMAVMWNDGGGINPDEITIVYADQNVPVSRPLTCAEDPGPCNTIDQSSVLNINPESFNPALVSGTPLDANDIARVESAYSRDMVLFAIDFGNCGDNTPSIVPFEITHDPAVNSAGGSDVLKILHNPGQSDTELNLPGGFNRQVDKDCAVIGLFHVVQYRVNPPPPTDNPLLERRDLGTVGGGQWVPVSNNIENLQVQYALGSADIFYDEPPSSPVPDDPNTWVTRVRVTVFGRSESTNLQGATAGVFASEDTHMRNAFSTTLVLRNQIYSAAELNFLNYN